MMTLVPIIIIIIIIIIIVIVIIGQSHLRRLCENRMCLQPTSKDGEAGDEVTVSGRSFQTRGAVTQNARSPIVD